MGVIDTHIEKQPPIKGHAWLFPFLESGDDVSQHGIPACGMAAMPAMLASVAGFVSSHGAMASDTAADAGTGKACTVPVKAGIW
jgi:hypothetical protein